MGGLSMSANYMCANANANANDRLAKTKITLLGG